MPIVWNNTVCHRHYTTLNTNMVRESFHRVLKVVYLGHKQNRRVDYLVHVLLKMNHHYIFNSLRKDEMGKTTYKTRGINAMITLVQAKQINKKLLTKKHLAANSKHTQWPWGNYTKCTHGKTSRKWIKRGNDICICTIISL